MRKIGFFLLIIALTAFSCKSSSSSGKSGKSQDNDTVVGEMAEAYGDLDKDGIDEKVIIYNTGRKSTQGTEREIRIYKKSGSKWTLWHTSVGAVLPSEYAGMKEEPFESINIERGCIVINHSGGGHQKWAYTHRYRYQNNTWKLIGATIFYGALCDFWDLFDYNLSIGKINFKRETEDCESNVGLVKSNTFKQQFEHKLSVLPEMDGYKPGTNKIILSPDLNFYY